MFKLEIGLKLEGYDFESPDFFRRGEIYSSLNFDGKVGIAWVKDKLAKRAMRIEKVSEHNFSITCFMQTGKQFILQNKIIGHHSDTAK